MAIKISDILDTVDTAMGVLKTVIDTPGINLIPYVSTLSSVIGVTHAAYTAGKNITPYITAIHDTFSGDKIPSQDELTALDTKIAELEAKVQAPLPPKEDGEEE